MSQRMLMILIALLLSSCATQIARLTNDFNQAEIDPRMRYERAAEDMLQSLSSLCMRLNAK